MLLIPAPPAFAAAATDAEHSTGIKDKPDPEKVEEAEMKTLEPGADAVPAPAPVGESKRKYRLVTIGKKRLPDPENLGSTSRRKVIFWATVTALGDDLDELRSGLGPKTYETKTRGELTYSDVYSSTELYKALATRRLVGLLVEEHTRS